MTSAASALAMEEKKKEVLYEACCCTIDTLFIPESVPKCVGCVEKELHCCIEGESSYCIFDVRTIVLGPAATLISNMPRP